MKRSDAILLIATGAAAVAWYAVLEKDRCDPDQNGVRSGECASRGGYHGGFSGSGDASASRGGFGEAGAAHGVGGGE